MSVIEKVKLSLKYLLHTVKQLFSNKAYSSFKFIVFSKDRPLQLHALLSSMAYYISGEYEIIVIYDTNNDGAYDVSYESLKNEFVNEKINFVRESESFQNTLRKTINSISSSKMFFLVDDIIFKNYVDLDALKLVDTKRYIFSLRHGVHLSYSFIVDRIQELPPYELYMPNVIKWKWKTGEFDWRYMHSVDGHLFDVEEVKFWVNNLKFKSPNTFEMSIQFFNRFNFYKYGLAFNESIIINIPCNQVQNEIQNIHGNLHQSKLLELWNLGYRIDFLSYHGIINKSVHEDLKLNLVKN